MCSDYDYIRHAWILQAMREIKTARKVGIDLVNFHANLNGMFYGEKRKILLDNMIRSLREIVRYAKKSQGTDNVRKCSAFKWNTQYR